MNQAILFGDSYIIHAIDFIHSRKYLHSITEKKKVRTNMADDIFPMPTQIPWDKLQEGVLVYLRHKTITTSSMNYAMLYQLKSDEGVKVMVFAPASAYTDVTMKHKIEDNQFYVELSKAATLEIFEKDGYAIGDEISCWSRYKAKPPFIPPELVTEDKICILIQKVRILIA